MKRRRHYSEKIILKSLRFAYGYLGVISSLLQFLQNNVLCTFFYFEANAKDAAVSLHYKVINVVTAVVHAMYTVTTVLHFEVFVSLVQEESIQISQ
jgi:hypothetical protein